MKVTQEVITILLTCLHNNMALTCYDELRTLPEGHKLYRQDIKKDLQLAMRHSGKVVDRLQKNFDVQAMEWQNNTANQLFDLNNAFILMNPEKRQQMVEFAKELMEVNKEES